MVAETQLPLPAEGGIAKMVDGEGRRLEIDEPEQLVQKMCPTAESIELASDGSASKPVLRCLGRAGWALVLLDPEGQNPVAAMRGVNPGIFP